MSVDNIYQLSHRGLMKIAINQNCLITDMLTIMRFEGLPGQEENARRAWSKALEDYKKIQKKIIKEDQGIKE